MNPASERFEHILRSSSSAAASLACVRLHTRCYVLARMATPLVDRHRPHRARLGQPHSRRWHGARALARGRRRGRNVMITGASQGSVRPRRTSSGAPGATVLFVARTEEKLRQTAKQIERAGGNAYVHPCDLTDPDDIDRMAAAALERHGKSTSSSTTPASRSGARATSLRALPRLPAHDAAQLLRRP